MEKLVNRFKQMVGLSQGIGTWAAYWDGNRIKTFSGKNSWTSKGAAKNAVRNALPHRECREAGFKSAVDACKFFEKESILTYKQLD